MTEAKAAPATPIPESEPPRWEYYLMAHTGGMQTWNPIPKPPPEPAVAPYVSDPDNASLTINDSYSDQTPPAELYSYGAFRQDLAYLTELGKGVWAGFNLWVTQYIRRWLHSLPNTPSSGLARQPPPQPPPSRAGLVGDDLPAGGLRDPRRSGTGLVSHRSGGVCMGYGFRRGFSTVVAAWDRRNDPPSPSTLDIFAVRTQLSLPAAHDYEVFDWMGNALPVPQWPLGPPFLTREPIYLRFTAQPVLTLAQGAPGR